MPRFAWPTSVERVAGDRVFVERDRRVEAVQIRGQVGGAADDVGVGRFQRECVLVVSGRRGQVRVEGHRNPAEATVGRCIVRVDRERLGRCLTREPHALLAVGASPDRPD